MITAVPGEKLRTIWLGILKYIQPALMMDGNTLTPERLYDLVENGTFVLLLVYTHNTVVAAQTLEILKTPHGRIMNLVTTGGEGLEDWQDELLEAIEHIARENECISIRTRGRIGWLRQLKRNGFKPSFFIAEKRLQ